MNAAACSWRVKMSWIVDFRMDSTVSRFSSPGIPKIRSTPSFLRAATRRSEALNTSCLPVECQSLPARAGATVGRAVTAVGPVPGPSPCVNHASQSSDSLPFQATEPTFGFKPAAIQTLHAAQISLRRRDILLAGEEQRHIDRDACEDGLTDSSLTQRSSAPLVERSRVMLSSQRLWPAR